MVFKNNCNYLLLIYDFLDIVIHLLLIKNLMMI